MTSQQCAKGFSLSELLVVVAVILVLLAILVVGIDKVYSHAMQVKCAHRLEQLGQALELYKMQSHTLLPKSWDPYSGRLWYQTLAAVALDDPKILSCPVVGDVPSLEGGGSGTPDTGREHVSELLSTLRWLDSQQVKTGTYAGRWTSNNTYLGGYCVGVSGLVLMAYFGFGCTDKHPPEFAETIRLAMQYLTSDVAQYKTGSDAGKCKDNYATVYGTGILAMAMSAASRVIEDPQLRQKARDTAQLAINYLAAIQADHGAFSYSGPATDQGDTNGTSWAYQGFGMAMRAGLFVPQSAKDKAEIALTHMMHQSPGREYGLSSYRFPVNGEPGWWLQDRNTQVGLNARVTFGHPVGSADVQAQLNFLTRDSGGQPRHIKLLIDGDTYDPGDGMDFYRHYHTTRALRQIGGSHWSEWEAVYPLYIAKHLVPVGDDMAYFPAECAGRSTQMGGGTTVGTRYSTALGATMLADTFDEQWYDPSWTPGTGSCSYGYNNRLGKDRRTPAADTILVMDYEHWEIDHDDVDVESNDDLSKVALRHDGRANALMGDGSVRTFRPEEIQPGNWTPQAGD